MNGGRAETLRVLRKPGGFPATVRKVLTVMRITLASRLAYSGEYLIRTVFLVLILFTFLQLWRSTSMATDILGSTGFTIPQLLWYLAFTESMTLSIGWISESEVDKEVRSGDLAYRLVRPLAYPLQHFGAQIGDRLFRFLLNLAVASALVLLFAGPIRLPPACVAAAIVTAAAAFLVDWALSFTISLTSFWIEDTFGLHLLYRRLVMLLGGVLIPLEAFPGWLEKIARALPFQYLAYGPARLFVQGTLDGAGGLLMAQAILLAGAVLPLLVVYSLGLRRVTAQGG
jgi:ABC-2 type transport system permease protein